MKITSTRGGKYRFTLNIEVDPMWIADGFDLQDMENDAGEIIRRLYNLAGSANSAELKITVVAAPHPDQIKAEQGYPQPGRKALHKE